jgi:hypothetical protein
MEQPSDFRLFSLGLPARYALSSGLFVAGAALALVFPSLWFLGLAASALGWAPLFLRPATNRPDDQGLEEWRLVSMAEVDRLEDSLKEARSLRRKMRSSLSALVGFLAVGAIVLALLASAASGRGDVSYLAGFAAVFLVPGLFFGRVSVFRPEEIARKEPSFVAFLSERPPEGLVVAPYIRFDRDSKGRDVPEDFRLLLEAKRPPADLVGIQVQCATNKGPNGEVPYLYAVVLTKGKSGPSYEAARSFRARGFEVEPGGDDEYGSVVIRQQTGNGGYCTTPADCVRLAKVCYEALGGLIAD